MLPGDRDLGRGAVPDLEGASTREAYRRALIELAARDPRVVCLEADLGGAWGHRFARRFPRRHFQFGIAEGTMIAAAAALAARGKVPFVNTMACFAALRAAEQVKLWLAYHRTNVKVAATHGGVASGSLGPTHQALEDLAVMRALPHLTVVVPADAGQAWEATWAAAALAGPVYLRLGREATPSLPPGAPRLELGRAQLLRPGGDLTLVAAGPAPVHLALGAALALQRRGVGARVLNLHTLKPLDAGALLAAARETGAVLCVEEHSVLGGLGGAVAEFLAAEEPVPVGRVGFPDCFCEASGTPADLMEAYDVTEAALVREAMRLLDLKARPRRGAESHGSKR